MVDIGVDTMKAMRADGMPLGSFSADHLREMYAYANDQQSLPERKFARDFIRGVT